MWKTTILGGALAAAAFATPGYANSTLISCIDYVISITDELAIQGQSAAGSQTAFEQLVCDRSAELDPTQYDVPTVVPVFVEEIGMATRVVIFPTSDDDD
ncbi:MAG: hypothetical protein AAGF88_04045 [Pseudomonadota bacterium]